MGVLDIVLEASAEAIVAEAVVERNVRLIGCLPLECRIGVVDRNEADDRLIAEHIFRVGIGREADQRRIRRHAWIAESAPSGTKPKLAERALGYEALLT